MLCFSFVTPEQREKKISHLCLVTRFSYLYWCAAVDERCVMENCVVSTVNSCFSLIASNFYWS